LRKISEGVKKFPIISERGRNFLKISEGEEKLIISKGVKKNVSNFRSS
jgi:hypothetical protein